MGQPNTIDFKELKEHNNTRYATLPNIVSKEELNEIYNPITHHLNTNKQYPHKGSYDITTKEDN